MHGLFLEGARWCFEDHCLRDEYDAQMLSVGHDAVEFAHRYTRSLPRYHVPFQALPLIHFVPRMDFAAPESAYQCPLYKTSARAGVLGTTGHSTNFVLALALPTDQSVDYWIRKGTAALAQSDT